MALAGLGGQSWKIFTGNSFFIIVKEIYKRELGVSLRRPSRGGRRDNGGPRSHAGIARQGRRPAATPFRGKTMLKVALGQFAVSRVWEENAQVCEDLMRRASEAGAGLLILPEGILARDITDPQIVLKAAQPLDGLRVPPARRQPGLAAGHPVLRARAHGRRPRLEHPGHAARRRDHFRVPQAASVRRLQHEGIDQRHAGRPDPAVAGDRRPENRTDDLLRRALPEMARRLALDGADLLALPAAWVRGSLRKATGKCW